MQKLLEWFKDKWSKFKECSLTKKVVYMLLILGVPIIICWSIASLTATKYEVLFSNIDAKDSGTIIEKLKEKKVQTKYEGNSILVPKDKVDQLRMEVMSEVPMTNGSEGFEILDKSKFGMTDAEMKINYQRALQGTLERTIKSFSQVESSRVLLVLPEDTVFNKDVTPGSASVYLSLKNGQTLSKEQVKGIVSLISGGVRNIPKENIKVIDDKMNVLSENLFEETNTVDSLTSTEKQQALKKKYEKETEDKVLAILEPVYGKGKIKVGVNADLNFDSNQVVKTDFAPKGTVVSEHIIDEKTPSSGSAQSESPVDNNAQNNIAGTQTTANGSRKESTTNYDVSKREEKNIKAPGEVKRITTSVVVDGNMDDQTKTSISNLVSSAVGFDTKRGDSIQVEGIRFNNAEQDAIKKQFDAMKAQEEQQKKMALYKQIAYIVVAVIAAIILLIIIVKKSKSKSKEDLIMGVSPDDIERDMLENDTPERVQFKPIELDMETERTHLEGEIKKYAQEKPEQVAEIVKSWLAEDER